VRACLRDGASWRGESAIRYLGGLGPAVEICEGCDLFVEGSYDAAFEGVTAVFHVAAVLGNSSSNQPLVSRAPDPPRDLPRGSGQSYRPAARCLCIDRQLYARCARCRAPGTSQTTRTEAVSSAHRTS
jgi:hypothetical protein